VRAILLAAGQGTRLRPLTEERPKALVEVGGSSMLARARASLEAAGISDLTVVTGYRADRITELGYETRHNPEFATTNMVWSLFYADDVLEACAVDGQDLLIVYGDVLFHPDLVRALCAAPATPATVVNTSFRELWERRMDDPLSDLETLRLDGEGRIVELGEKPSGFEDIEGQYTGLIRVGAKDVGRVREIWAGLRESEAEARGLYMTRFLTHLFQGGLDLWSVPVAGGWMEVDAPEDIPVAESMLAELEE
jgi:L-glutamine-phosphate cytidylyltransferase